MEEKEKIEEEKTALENETTEVVETVVAEEVVTGNDKQNSKGLSIASLVLGIVAFFVSKWGLLAIACAVLAIVFGVKGQKRAGKGMAKAGFILGIIYLSLIAIVFLLVVILGVGIGSALFGALM